MPWTSAWTVDNHKKQRTQNWTLVNSQLDAKLFTKGVVFTDTWCSISIYCLNKFNLPFLNTQLLRCPPDDFSMDTVESLFEIYKSKIEWLMFSAMFLCICQKNNMVSMVPWTVMKPHCILLILSDDSIMFLMTSSTIFMMRSNSFNFS